MSDMIDIAGGRSPEDAIEIEESDPGVQELQGEAREADVLGAITDNVEDVQDARDRPQNAGLQRNFSQDDISDAALLLQFHRGASGLPTPPAVASSAVASSAVATSPAASPPTNSSPPSAALSSPLSSARSSASPPSTSAAAKPVSAATKPVYIAPAPPAPEKAPKIAAARKKPKKRNNGLVVPGFSQKKHVKGGHKGDETFEHHPTDPSLIVARYRVKNPYDDTDYEQVNELREMDATKTPQDPPQFVLEPDLALHKVPRRVRKNEKNGQNPALFIQDYATGVWTRAAGDHGPEIVWTPAFLFRRLDSETGEYLQAYTNVKRMENIDPNDKSWAYAYNKWLDQIKRRRDSTYEQHVHKHHWSHDERAALYDAVNAFISKCGLSAFGSDMAAKDVQVMTDAVNNVGGMGRGVDAVRGQIASSHARKNKAIFELISSAHEMRQQIANGVKFTLEEQYPDEAIPQSQFPDGKGGNGKARGGRRRKADKEDGSEDGLETDSDTDSEDDADQPEPTVPWYIASPPDAAAVLETKGSGIPPNRAERETAWEVADVEEDWSDVESEDAVGESGDEEDGESAWEDMSDQLSGDLEMQDISEERAAYAKLAEDQVAELVSRACTPTKNDEKALSAPVTPSGKRKCILDADESDKELLASPQRSIKKARGMTGK